MLEKNYLLSSIAVVECKSNQLRLPQIKEHKMSTNSNIEQNILMVQKSNEYNQKDLRQSIIANLDSLVEKITDVRNYLSGSEESFKAIQLKSQLSFIQAYLNDTIKNVDSLEKTEDLLKLLNAITKG